MTGDRLRQSGELALPGAGIGVLAGLVATGLALVVGQPAGWSVAAGVALGLPLALLGGGFGLLQASGVLSAGVFAAAALYWLVGFPVARLLQEVLVGPLTGDRPALPPDLLGFLAYQAMVSLGFAIGFSWLHERLAARWLRRIRHRNPRAERLYAFYMSHAAAQWRAREARRRARAGTGRVSRPNPKGE